MQIISHEKLLNEVEKLNQSEQLQLLEKIAALIRRRTTAKTRRSILELQGVGKSIWKDIDAQQYIHKERKSWNG
jgi:hypothetical protein